MRWVKRRLFISAADPAPDSASASSISSASFAFGLTSLPLASEEFEVDCPLTASVKLRERATSQLRWLNRLMMWLRMIWPFSAARRARHTSPGQPEGLAYALALEFGV